MTYAQVLVAALPAFLASTVEFVEALTIVLAVGVTRGWRQSLLGTLAGVITLAALVAIFGPLLKYVPLAVLQLVIGALLLFFGMRWLRKAALRYANVIALHDEEKAFAKETARLQGGAPQGFDFVAFATTYQAVVLEGLEVVFIVLAVGSAAKALVPATIGAAIAGVFVIGAGILVHKPLSRIPENALKFVVGVMLSAFGAFWVGEGFKFEWPGSDLSLILLIIGFGLVALVTGTLVRRAPVVATK